MSDNRPRIWYCIYEAYDEDEKGKPLPGTSSIVGHESDPTGANLSWENPFKVIEYSAVQRLESRIENLREALNKITIQIGPNSKGHSPRNSVSIALGLAFDVLFADDEAAK